MEERWITVNGNHILIKDGQSVEEAIAERFDNFEDDNGVDEKPMKGALPKEVSYASQYAKETALKNYQNMSTIDIDNIIDMVTKKYGITDEEGKNAVEKSLKKYLEKNQFVFKKGIEKDIEDNEIKLPETELIDVWDISKGKFFKKEFPVDYGNIDKQELIDYVRDVTTEYFKNNGALNTKIIRDKIASLIVGFSDSNGNYLPYRTKYSTIAKGFQKLVDKIWAEKRKPLVEAGKKLLSTYKTQNFSDEARLNLVNYDNYNEGEEYQTNCYKCAQAYDMLCRGYDVEADKNYNGIDNHRRHFEHLLGWNLAGYVEPVGGLDVYGKEINYLAEGRVRKWQINQKGSLGGIGKTQFENIKKIISKSPEGSRWQCCVAWQSDGGHVFNIIKQNGQVKFIEPQDSTTDISYYFRSGAIRPKYTVLCRVDNLDISEEMKYMVNERKA